jgi:dihydrofolate reductase/thymidylate synthase
MVSTEPDIAIVVAFTDKFGIGKNGTLPWPHIKADMERFKLITDGGVVVMGRKTYESLPEKAKPLKNRLNIVVSRTSVATDYPNAVVVVKSLEEALDHVSSSTWPSKKIFIIGGASLFSEGIIHECCRTVFATRIGVDPWECDVSVPKLEAVVSGWIPVSVSKTFSLPGECLIPYDFVEFRNPLARSRSTETDAGTTVAEDSTGFPSLDHEEYQYLNLIRKIIAKGVSVEDRTGVGTLSLFGESSMYDLSESFPLLTTKRVFWRGVVEELLWFVKGDTNARHLSDKGVKIWDGNGSRAFLDSRGLPEREEMDLGPVYGFQWRHFGAKYKDMHADYTGQGVDQLQACIDKIKNNPSDRRIILSAWNPADLDQMALPPCHMFCQFNVENGKLNCIMYQRSCDMGLGVPFNIASYSLLTVMMAKICALKPGRFTHFMGDTHVYKNHVEPLKEQIQRLPKPFPVLRVKERVGIRTIDDFEASDFELLGYNCHGKISMEMAV